MATFCREVRGEELWIGRESWRVGSGGVLKPRRDGGGGSCPTGKLVKPRPSGVIGASKGPGEREFLRWLLLLEPRK